MPTPVAEIWNAVQAQLRREVPETVYESWLAPLQAASFEGDVLRVQAPGALRGWVADRFAETLDRAAATVLGPQAR
ncbi:MAG: chromosomal replication initiator protein DnaA, partial [Solirubrobacteraceae bacterium]|nr:chromosomal replication initiator protein DnaA [Solirubrobacteraceae bacterium]